MNILKKLLDALSRRNQSEQDLKTLGKKYRLVKFGPDYKDTEPVGELCLFCAKPEKDIKQLVTGVDSRICDECIDLSYELIHESQDKKDTYTFKNFRSLRSLGCAKNARLF